jgi:hypothetical protein
MGKYHLNENVPKDRLLPDEKFTGERKIIKSKVVIDRVCFRKTEAEKARLKIEKAKSRMK